MKNKNVLKIDNLIFSNRMINNKRHEDEVILDYKVIFEIEMCGKNCIKCLHNLFKKLTISQWDKFNDKQINGT